MANNKAKQKGGFGYPYIVTIAVVGSALFDYFTGKNDLVELFLFYTLVIAVGIMGCVSFYMHYFRGDKIAKGIGWPIGSPFQKEVAFTGLAMGITGLMCIWFDNGFWIATIVFTTVFMWGAAYGHIVEMIKKKNFEPGNAGPVLYFDIFMPLALIILASIYFS